MILLGLALAVLGGGDILAGSKTIDVKSIERDLFAFARMEMQGRDSPSAGQRRAAELISARMAEFGFVPAADASERLAPYTEVEAVEGASAVAPNLYLRPFTRGLEAPVAAECSFVHQGGEEEEEVQGEMGVDWVPVLGCAGSFSGEVVFAGFGIRSKGDRYDDFAGLKLEGRVALILSGEPRHKRKFDGPEQSSAASLWGKLHELQDAGVEGVLVVRRASQLPKGKRSEFTPLALDYRYTHAQFPGVREERPPRRRPPVVEITPAFAQVLLGVDVLDVAAKIDRGGRPKRLRSKSREVSVRSSLSLQQVRIDNVVGILPGADPDVAGEYVVIGAHYDHIGVDSGGRVGPGADDNGSGSAGLLAIAEALATSRPARSVILCAFSGEEDGLLGSKALCGALPVERRSIIAMLNMDMIGRGGVGEVAVLGAKRNPSLDAHLRRANEMGRTGVSKLVTGQGEELWMRSDHYPFHQIGIPALFFFEGLPISRNADYHTWRDQVDEVSIQKIQNTCRLVHQTACLIANDESRPPPPRSRR